MFFLFRDNSRFWWHAQTYPTGQSRATAPGTHRFDNALYSTRTRENAVMMVVRPWGILRREGSKSDQVDLRGDELKDRPETLPLIKKKRGSPVKRNGDNESRSIFIIAFRRK